MAEKTRLDVRPTEGQHAHVLRAAELLGIPMAAYIRLLIDRDMDTHRKRRRRNAVKLLTTRQQNLLCPQTPKNPSGSA